MYLYNMWTYYVDVVQRSFVAACTNVSDLESSPLLEDEVLEDRQILINLDCC